MSEVKSNDVFELIKGSISEDNKMSFDVSNVDLSSSSTGVVVINSKDDVYFAIAKKSIQEFKVVVENSEIRC